MRDYDRKNTKVGKYKKNYFTLNNEKRSRTLSKE